MADKIDLYKTLLTPKQRNDLLAIYCDYLYFTRKLEQFKQKIGIKNLAFWEIKQLYGDAQPVFPWKIERISDRELSEFNNFIHENIHTDTGAAYISLQHTDPQKNNSSPISYIPDQYKLINMDMDLPCPVERYIIAYPENSIVGQTPLYIDGKYKAVYIREESANALISDIFSDHKVQAEFRLLLDMIDYFDGSEHLYEDEKNRMSGICNTFASELVSPLENNILETLGSFAEKCQEISRILYRGYFRDHPLKAAQKNQLIPSAEAFQDYINIRHLLRHQWDSMDELGKFNSTASDKNSQLRASFLQSYLKLCGKPLRERIDEYTQIIDQLQFVIDKVYPDILIRFKGETNSKFVQRAKEYHAEQPQQPINVITNYPVEHEKRTALMRNLQKIFTNLKILDEYKNIDKATELDNDYFRRSAFLRAYNNLECQMMTYCLTRGKNLSHQAAWEYFYRHKLISETDYKTWREFTALRNDLSHGHYTDVLKQKLKDRESEYLKLSAHLEKTINDLFPKMVWIKPNVYVCEHRDGQKITLDFTTHEIITKDSSGKVKTNNNQPNGTNQKQAIVETYPGDIEISSHNCQIISLRLPSGVEINLKKRRIIWPSAIKWHTNAENFNTLTSPNHKIFTDKELRVTEYRYQDTLQKICPRDTFLLEHSHRLSIDKYNRLQSFVFRIGENQKLETTFRQERNETTMIFSDGTELSFENSSLSVRHNGQTLTYENRKKFAATYADVVSSTPQFIRTGHTR